MVWNGELTSHWSILTAIGDGIRFAGGMSQQESADCLFNFASQIKDSGIPGVMVVNLHPQNVSETLQMHHAVKEIVASGFVAWNMRECLNWFQMKEKRRWKVVDHLKRLFIKYK
jgi:hypothetical protein